jgi:hypothetical protein
MAEDKAFCFSTTSTQANAVMPIRATMTLLTRPMVQSRLQVSFMALSCFRDYEEGETIRCDGDHNLFEWQSQG